MGIPGYEEAESIGQGGFATVYKARQTAFDRVVAIKVFSAPGLDADTRRRFDHECRALGKVSGHPNIVAVYDSGLSQTGRPYITMSYVTGGSLAQRMAGRGPMLWHQAVEIGIKLAGALETAHRAGVLHRDIKPENVLFSAYGDPELADFGASTIQEGTALSSTVITASLPYAAPEVLDGRTPSTAADVYSLASTIFTLLAAHAAFVRSSDEHLHALLNRVINEPVPDLRPRGVPHSVCDVLERAMAKRPEDRQIRAADFGADLQQVQRDAAMTATLMSLAIPEDAATDPRAGLNIPHTADWAPVTVADDDWTPVSVTVGEDDSRTVARASSRRPPPPGNPAGPKPKSSRRAWTVAGAVAAGLLVTAVLVALILSRSGRSGGTAAGTIADISITLPGAPGLAEAGRDLRYEVMVTNGGPVDATEVTVVDAVPSGVIFKAATSDKSCKATGLTITCRPGAVAKGSSVKLAITIVVLLPGRITNNVTVSGAQADPQTANNSATAKTTVRRCSGAPNVTTTTCV